MRSRLLCLLLLVFASLPGFAADDKAAPPASPTAAKPKLKQYLYVLKLVPRLHDDKAWTDADKAVLGRHVENFKRATASGQLLLAGRTLEAGDKTFGLAIFTATDEEAARAFMNADPCVVEKIMTAELHPFYAAFGSKL